jgi:hypothetical protein
MTVMDDFEKMNWHDNHIHNFHIRESEDDWSGVLELDIDYILEWRNAENNAFNFLINPATLCFHGVTDLVIKIDYSKAPARVGPIMIHEIERELKNFPNGYSTFNWCIELGWPTESFISFSAGGFSQVLRGKPVLSGSQYLLPLERQASLHLTHHSSGTPNGAP